MNANVLFYHALPLLYCHVPFPHMFYVAELPLPRRQLRDPLLSLCAPALRCVVVVIVARIVLVIFQMYICHCHDML